MGKSSIICALLATSVVPAALVAAKEKIPTATSFDSPPYKMNNSTGGLEVAILASALDMSEDEFEYLPMSLDDVETSIGRGVAEIALSVQIPADGSYEKDGVYYSYPSWPFHNYVFTKTEDDINGNEPITSIQDLDDYGPVFTWEGAVDELGGEFNAVFSNSAQYRPIGNQIEQMDLFWNTPNALIVIDRTIFLDYSFTIVENVPGKIVEHNLFDPVTTYGVGFASKDMRDRFNEGLVTMCEGGDYLTLLVEYGVEMSDEDKIICDVAKGETSGSDGVSHFANWLLPISALLLAL